MFKRFLKRLWSAFDIFVVDDYILPPQRHKSINEALESDAKKIRGDFDKVISEFK